jgi:hypothetical protein
MDEPVLDRVDSACGKVGVRGEVVFRVDEIHGEHVTGCLA